VDRLAVLLKSKILAETSSQGAVLLALARITNDCGLWQSLLLAILKQFEIDLQTACVCLSPTFLITEG